MSMSTKYCALCGNETYTVWSISRGGELAVVPLCEDHDPQISRLFRLCKVGSMGTPESTRPRPKKQRTRGLSFEALDWTPPGPEGH